MYKQFRFKALFLIAVSFLLAGCWAEQPTDTARKYLTLLAEDSRETADYQCEIWFNKTATHVGLLNSLDSVPKLDEAHQDLGNGSYFVTALVEQRGVPLKLLVLLWEPDKLHAERVRLIEAQITNPNQIQEGMKKQLRRDTYSDKKYCIELMALDTISGSENVNLD